MDVISFEIHHIDVDKIEKDKNRSEEKQTSNTINFN